MNSRLKLEKTCNGNKEKKDGESGENGERKIRKNTS